MSKVAEAYLDKDYEAEEPKRVSKRKPPINMSEKINAYIMVYHVRMVFVMNVKYTMKGVKYKCIQEIGIGISVISIDELAGPAELIAKRG